MQPAAEPKHSLFKGKAIKSLQRERIKIALEAKFYANRESNLNKKEHI